MLAQKLVLSYGSKIVIQLMQIAASIVVARVAGPTVLGTVAFGLAFVSMFEFLADLGIGPAHIKLVSEGQDIGKCISTYSVFKIVNITLFAVVVFGFYLAQKYVFNINFESTAHETVILVTLLAVTINEITYIPKMTFAAKTEQAKQDIPDIVRTVVYQILRIVLVLIGYKAVALAFGNLVSTILIVPIVFYLFKDYPRAKFDRELASRYLKISLPVILIGMSTNLIFYLDKVVLQYFTNSQQVGYYVAGYRIGGLIFMIGTSAGLIFFPLFSKAASKRDFVYIGRTINRYERFVFIFLMPAVMLVSLYSKPIVNVVLGSEYLQSAGIVTLIAIAMLFSISNMPYDNVITGMGFFKLAAYLNIFSLVLFVLMLLILPNPRVLNLGAVGVAYTILISNVFMGVVFRFFSRRKCPGLHVGRNLHLLIFGFINYGIFCFLRNYAEKRFGDASIFVIVIVYFLVVYSSLLVLGWIKKDDLRSLQQLINLKKLMTYIRGEVMGK